MSALSRFIIVSFLPENATQKDFLNLCSEYGPVRNCRIQKSDKGFLCGFCEFESCDSATVAVRSLNARAQSDGSQLRASFSKAKPNHLRSCHLRVKFLPKNTTHDEVVREFSRFGNITRCKVIPYERNAMAHLSFDTIESAETARSALNNQHWVENPDFPSVYIEFCAPHINGRKTNSQFNEEEYNECQAAVYNHNNSMPIDDTISMNHTIYQSTNPQQMNVFYNYSQQPYMNPNPQVHSFDMNSQDFSSQTPKPGNVQPAQYVQFNPYSWPNNYPSQQASNLALNMYDTPTNQQQPNGINQSSNGLANSPPIKPATTPQENGSTNNQQWVQQYSQLVQQMQNTHMYQSNPSQYQQNPGSFGVQQNMAAHPLLLNPQSVYCATAISPTPQNYPILLNSNTGAYFRGFQPTMQHSTGLRYSSGPQFRHGLNYSMMASGTLPKSNLSNRGSSNNTLYVYNTGNSMTEDGLRALFSRFGTIIDVSVPKDPNTGASRNFGFVNYLEPAAASIAIEHMNGYILYDRVLQVSYKRPRLSANVGNQRTSATTGNSKSKKELDVKQEMDGTPSHDSRSETKSVTAEEEAQEVDTSCNTTEQPESTSETAEHND